MKTPSVLIPTSLFKKQARDGQKEDSRPCYSLKHFSLLSLFDVRNSWLLYVVLVSRVTRHESLFSFVFKYNK